MLSSFLFISAVTSFCINGKTTCRRSKECVDVDLLCNGFPDCKDKSDEKNCKTLISCRTANYSCMSLDFNAILQRFIYFFKNHSSNWVTYQVKCCYLTDSLKREHTNCIEVHDVSLSTCIWSIFLPCDCGWPGLLQFIYLTTIITSRFFSHNH